MLGEDSFALLEHNALRSFVFTCQSPMGGFRKSKNAFPDMLHSFYSMSYVNLSGRCFEESDRVALKEMNCTLGICQETAAKFNSAFP